MKDSEAEPNGVIVERGEVVDVQHHLGLTAFVPINPAKLRDRVGGALVPHFTPILFEIPKQPQDFNFAFVPFSVHRRREREGGGERLTRAFSSEIRFRPERKKMKALRLWRNKLDEKK